MINPDERARLEIERDFLLNSLRDLEAEWDAGDIDLADYTTLKDSYTARTAEVLRQLTSQSVRSQAVRSRGVVWGIAMLIIVVLSGVLLVRASNDRLPGQVMTGGIGTEGIGDGSVSSLLVQARSLGMSDMPRVLDIYAEVLAVEPDNVEALTYFGWFSVLSAVQTQSASEDNGATAQRLESGVLLLRQATITDPTYADAHCFLGIVFFRFLDDADAARPEIETCLASNPPAEVYSLVENLATEIAAATETE